MFKKYRVLSAPFAFFATSLILVIAMMMPGDAFPARSVIAMSSAPTGSVIEAAPSDVEALSETEAETEPVLTSEASEPARAASVCSFKESAPPSFANSLVDQSPRLQQEIRADSAAQEDAQTELPADNVVFYTLNEEEYGLLCWCVEGEVRGKSFEHHVIIAQVIMNRVFSDRFPNTVKQVVLSPKQFSPMVWYNANYVDQFVSPITRQAVDAVMNGEVEDLSQGALYFCNPKTAGSIEWFENCLVTLFDFEGHRFYTDRH